MTKEDRRADRAALDAEYTRQQQARPNVPPSAPPPIDAPAYCPCSRDHRHYGWTSKDGIRRCQSCCAVWDPIGGTWLSAIKAARAQEQAIAATTTHGGEQ